MSQLKAVARLRIHEGKLEEFKRLAAEAVRAVREKNSGTLQYEWHFTPDMRQCVVLEAYRDSDAVLVHMANLGETLGALTEVADLSIDAFGEPSQELLAASEGMNITFHSQFQSV